MSVIKVSPWEHGQNEFGLRSFNRAKLKGNYRCTSCGAMTVIWCDHTRLPICLDEDKPVEWELISREVEDVSQAGH